MSDTATLDNETVQSFADRLRSPLIAPGDANYDAARQVWNGMIDKRPALIARCSGTADVIDAVNFAREHDLLTAVKGGGHNAAGNALCEDGLVIDLSPMNSVRVDPRAQTARVEPGVTLAELDHETQAFGLATSTGQVSMTGIAGLTLGGGWGWLSRTHGLTIDNLLSADVVLADGSFVTASADENEDLFWAIRGGGGNFGVVTSFEFQAHPVDTVYGGPMFWDVNDAAEMMRYYRDFIAYATDDVYGFFDFHIIPPGDPFPEALHLKNVCGIVWCYTGPLDEAEEVLAPVRAFKKPILDLAGPIPFPTLQTLFDGLYPPGLQWYWKGDFVRELPDAAIEKHVEFGSKIPSFLSGMHLYPIDGAVHEVDAHETAWSYRDVRWSSVMVGVDADPENTQRITQWARDYWEALHPYAAGGAYVNFLMEEGQDRVQATYGPNYERLVRIKNKYDPANLFRVNQNIQPTAAPAA